MLALLLCISADPGPSRSRRLVREEESHWCGPASLASVHAYYGCPDVQQAIAQAVYTDALQGRPRHRPGKLRGFPGLPDQARPGTAEEVKACLHQGVRSSCWWTWFLVLSQHHYLVITGYSDTGFIANTGTRRADLSLGEFEQMWRKRARLSPRLALTAVLLALAACSMPRWWSWTTPLSAREHMDLGLSYEAQGRLDLARREYLKAAAGQGDWATPHSTWATSPTREGISRQPSRTSERPPPGGRQSPDIMNNLAGSQHELGRDAEARDPRGQGAGHTGPGGVPRHAATP